MKTLIVSAVLASFALLSAGAQAADVGHDKTRAEVVAELAQAKADGQYTFGNLDYPPAMPQTSSLTRAQVKAQLAQAKADGQYTFGNLDYPPQQVASADDQNGQAKRNEVVAELAQAKADGQYTFGNLDYPPAQG
jgi:anti-sigma28 factor (negative regulator of flagellin synthesis)